MPSSFLKDSMIFLSYSFFFKQIKKSIEKSSILEYKFS